MRQMAGVFGQLERGMVTMRTRTGKRRKGARGGDLGGTPRFGARPEDEELVSDEGEQAAIARMRELHGQGLSRRQIAEALTAEGYPAKRGGSWHQVTVGRVLEQEGLA
jgi:DNA invertase Pin-like site-specific DNA recombinase